METPDTAPTVDAFFAGIIDRAKAAYPNKEVLRTLFDEIIAHDPTHYPNHCEPGFEQFFNDIAQCVGKKPDTVKTRTQAQYKFTPSELADLGKKLATTRKDMARVESELDSIKQDFKGKLAAIELEQDRLCRKLDDGFEMVEVPAIITFNDPSQGRKTYRNEETGELIREEPMSPADWQLPMFQEPIEETPALPLVPGEPVTQLPRHETLEDGSTITRKTTKVANPTASSPIGATNLGNVLDMTVAGTEAPLLEMDLTNGGKSFTSSSFMRSFKKAAFGRWTDPQISTMESKLREKDTVSAMVDMIRPHVLTKDEPAVDPGSEPFGPTEEKEPSIAEVVERNSV